MAPDSGAPQGLNRHAVIDAAMGLLHEVGVDGLSMRGLAERLGVKAASLYWHVRDKEQVLELLADAVLDSVVVPAGAAGWRDRVSAACGHLAARLRDREAAALLLACLPVLRRSTLAAEISGILADAGLPDPGGAAFALLVDVVAAASVAPAPAVVHGIDRVMTLAIDSGSYRVTVHAGAPDMVDPAASVGGGGAASLETHDPDRVIVRGRRGGNRGAVLLNPRYAWRLKVHGGTWNTTADLTGLRLRGVELDSGAGNVTAVLPPPVGVVPLKVNSGLVGVTLRRPRNAAVHALVHSGSVKVRFDGKPLRVTPSDVRWESPGASGSADRYELTVHSGCVKVSMDATAPDIPAPPAAPAAMPPAGAEPAQDAVGLILDGIESRIERA
jgi:AcrR family transcriptional regulator